ncbi:hypothetical protein KXD93_13720 [Mucilaginibacter sp. BJC16-A38]|uniref:hypothetical protein n=1 Tax=Mucilaginibacter phenanthrenivorans TaxID=1234842 RepID=UPI0021579A47|nr:hypothetical protein [Mucilaginibacter phenanthrenivorans]MCR8558710.1 hypothetical protein [Mucilaginibacter phenanthrenivorans]
MKTSVKTTLFLVVFGLMVISAISANAQCAQCAATVASNSANGGSAANGLNNGILFLLGAPYLAVTVAGIIWYKKYRRKNVDLNIRDEKLNLN